MLATNEICCLADFDGEINALYAIVCMFRTFRTKMPIDFLANTAIIYTCID